MRLNARKPKLVILQLCASERNQENELGHIPPLLLGKVITQDNPVFNSEINRASDIRRWRDQPTHFQVP